MPMNTNPTPLSLRPGEIVSLGDRIVWVNVFNRMHRDVPFVIYNTKPMDELFSKYDPNIVQIMIHTSDVGYGSDQRIKFVKSSMGVLQDIDVYELEVPLRRRILAIFKPIRIYGYRYDPRTGKVEKMVVEFRGLNLKPKIVERRWL